jgi:hypothetical protein
VVTYSDLTSPPSSVLPVIRNWGHTKFWVNQLWLEATDMSKGQDSKKADKKKPLLTAKEKKAAKKSKKGDTNVLGN